jgi:hypothetical protein
MAKAKERVNKRNIFQLQARFSKFRTSCDFSVTADQSVPQRQ